jgi:hypothetical protein
LKKKYKGWAIRGTEISEEGTETIQKRKDSWDLDHILYFSTWQYDQAHT